MKTSIREMEWLLRFSVANLMLGCLLFKKNFKINEFCALSKAARMLSKYLKQNLGLLRLYSLSHLDSRKPMKMLARTGAKRKTHGYSIQLIIKLTVKNKMSL